MTASPTVIEDANAPEEIESIEDALAELDASVEASEAPATESASENAAPVATEAAPATPAEEPADLTAFNEAVAAVRQLADPQTGQFADESVLEPVLEAYRDLPNNKTGKLLVKKQLEAEVRELMDAVNFPAAAATSKIRDALRNVTAPKAPKAEKAPVAPVDPTDSFVEQVLAYRLALAIVTNQVPDGVSDNWSDIQAARYTAAGQVINDYAAHQADPETYAKPDKIEPWIESAFALASGKALKATAKKGRKARAATDAGVTASGAPKYSGPRRSVQKHILEIFENLPVGTFLKVSQMNDARSAEYGPNDAPSSGALSSALKNFPAAQYGFEIVDEPKGLRKIA